MGTPLFILESLISIFRSTFIYEIKGLNNSFPHLTDNFLKQGFYSIGNW